MKRFSNFTKISLSLCLIFAALGPSFSLAQAQILPGVYLYDDIAANWSGNGVGGVLREKESDTWKITEQANFTGDNYFKISNFADNTDNDFNTPADSAVWSNDVVVNDTALTPFNLYPDGNTLGGKFPVTNGKYYVITFSDVLTTTSSEGYVMETSNPPVTITNLTQSPAPGEVSDNDSVTITVTLSGPRSPEERVYIRYSTSNWASASALEVTSFDANNQGTVTTPKLVANTQFQYYALTTTIPSASWGDNVDLVTINYRDNGGFTYSYIVKWGTTQDGNWSQPATWASGVVPNDPAKNVLIAHNVTLDMDVNLKSLTVRADGTFTASDATPRTITIADTLSNVANLTNHGVFNHGGGTITFAGQGAVSGPVVFNNVNLAAAGLPRGVNFGSASTLEGTLTIHANHFISYSPPTYGSASLLKYDTGGEYGLGYEWRYGASGQGVPYNVEIAAGTTLTTTNAYGDRDAQGNLHILGGVRGETSYALNLGGNWINDGTYANNGGTVAFIGSAPQSLGGTTPTTFNKLVVNSSSTVTLNTSPTVTGTLSLASGILDNTGHNLTLGDGATISRATGDILTAPLFGSSVNLLYTGGTGVSSGPELPTSNTILNNLTIENSGGVTLLQDETVNGTLTLTVGTLAIGTHTLTLDGPATATGGLLGSDPSGTVLYNQGLDGQGVLAGSYGNLTFNNYTKTLATAGTIGIANLFDPGTAGGHSIISSTVEYNGAAPQSLPSGFPTYYNLTLNNAAGATGFASLGVQGLAWLQSGTFTASGSFHDVQIEAGATWNADGDLTVSGDWTQAGNFTHNNHLVTFDGSGPQAISGTTDFYNLTIANSAAAPDDATDVDPDAPLLVENNLNLSDGQFQPPTGSSFKNLSIGTNGILKPDIDAALGISGNFSNQGTYTHNNSALVFDGSGLQNLSALVPTNFYTLTVNSGVTLVETEAADNAAIDAAGLLNNGGIIRKSQAVSGTGPLTFGLTGVKVNVTAQGTLSGLQVDRTDSDHPNATTAIQTGKYWTLTPTGSGYTLNLTLPHSALSDPAVCLYPGNLGGYGWDCQRTGFDGTTVWRDGLTTLADFAVGQKVGPTAITLDRLAARSSWLSTPAWLLVLGAAALLAGALTRRKLRSQ